MQLGHEPTPYKKKSKKRKPQKSDHKHQYKDVIGILDDEDRMPVGAKKCTVCGKVVLTKMFFSEKVEGKNLHRMLSKEEVLEKYSDLEVVCVKL